MTFGSTVTTDADQASCLLKLKQKQRDTSIHNQLLHGNPIFSLSLSLSLSPLSLSLQLNANTSAMLSMTV